ncbi:MAG: hypothetical protein IKV97_07395 [Clostridia bacterium]|nr:hypothetical protein [Clostridia bacterium]
MKEYNFSAEKRNIVTAAALALWVVLLGILMIRLPVSNLMNGMDVSVADIVFSACFCAIGPICSVLGYIMRSKTLILISALNAAMIVLSAFCFCMYVITFSRDVLAVALRLINQFCAILVTPGIVFLAIFALLTIAFPIAATFLADRKSKGILKNK